MAPVFSKAAWRCVWHMMQVCYTASNLSVFSGATKLPCVGNSIMVTTYKYVVILDIMFLFNTCKTLTLKCPQIIILTK